MAPHRGRISNFLRGAAAGSWSDIRVVAWTPSVGVTVKAEGKGKVTEELKGEGFGVLSDVNISAKMKEKLNVDMRGYRIFRACNPALAHQAISAVPDIGLLLPCNVLVWEDNNGHAPVSFMSPESVLSLVDHPDVAKLAV